MKSGQVVPKVTHEECLDLMFSVVNDPELHIGASSGYKKVGQSIDLYGKEDMLVCREAGTFWNEETTDKFPSMRAKIDSELAAVADEFESGGITWCEQDVRRLITPYPSRPAVDRILDNLGEDAYTDDIHHLEGICDRTAVADEEAGNSESASSDDDGDDPTAVAGHVPTAVAGEDCEDELQDCELDKLPGLPTDGSHLSAEQADAIHKAKLTMSALEGTLEGLRAIGSVRCVHSIELELAKERRKVRELIKCSPAVAECFSRLRRNSFVDRRVCNCVDNWYRVRDYHVEKKSSADRVVWCHGGYN